MTNKINLFAVLMNREQTNFLLGKVAKREGMARRGYRRHETTLETHLFMLSKHFRLFNLFDYADRVSEFRNPLIYHIPAGRDRIETGVEDILSSLKGKVPILARTYDPHSPYKTSPDYLLKYHDVVLTYIRAYVDNESILFGAMCYDNHIFGMPPRPEPKERLVCMILRHRTDPRYHVPHEEYKRRGIDLRKTYHLRQEVVLIRGIDIYGHGWDKSLPNYKGPLFPFEKKYDVLKKYRFSIVLENCIVDSFISEKIMDCFLTLTVPVYLGSPTIARDIPEGCFIDISRFKAYRDVFEFLHSMPAGEYEQYVDNIIKQRERIFTQFATENSFSKRVYDWYNGRFGTNLGLLDTEYEAIRQNISKLKYKKSGTIETFIERAINAWEKLPRWTKIRTKR